MQVQGQVSAGWQLCAASHDDCFLCDGDGQPDQCRAERPPRGLPCSVCGVTRRRLERIERLLFVRWAFRGVDSAWEEAALLCGRSHGDACRYREKAHSLSEFSTAHEGRRRNLCVTRGMRWSDHEPQR